MVLLTNWLPPIDCASGIMSTTSYKWEAQVASCTILIVDDEANQRLFLEQALVSLHAKCAIIQAASAAEALEALASQVITLLITDYYMPLMTGIDLVAALRMQNNQVPVIMVSAYSLDDLQDSARRLSIDHFLVKPFSLDHLRHAASTLLSRAA